VRTRLEPECKRRAELKEAAQNGKVAIGGCSLMVAELNESCQACEAFCCVRIQEAFTTSTARESLYECRAPALAGERQGNAYPVAISTGCFGGAKPPTRPEVVASQGDPVLLLVSPTVADGITKGHWLLGNARLLAAASFVAELRHQTFGTLTLPSPRAAWRTTRP
jgi:hypothetical protein